jgi:DNA adenine methylase
MRPFFCRQGSKRKYSEALVSLFPPHKTYVEPFLGGGAVFWEKEPSEKEVINDLDAKLVADYRRIAKAPLTGYKVLTTKAAQNAFLKQKKGVADKVLESLIRRCNGFGGTYIDGSEVVNTTTHEDKLKNIAEYKKRLNHATLTNEGYDAVLRKYDGDDTFFFLDPPYEKSVGLDYAEGSDKFPFAKFAEDVKKLNGKFILTINDSQGIRKLFAGLHLYPYVVKGHHAKGVGADDRKELLITNYALPRRWKSKHTGGTHRIGTMPVHF